MTTESEDREDLHRPCPGQTELLCDFYINMMRGVILTQAAVIAGSPDVEATVKAQATYMRDLERRLAGKPLTLILVNDDWRP